MSKGLDIKIVSRSVCKDFARLDNRGRVSRQFKVDNVKLSLVKCHSYMNVKFNLKSNLVKCHSCIYINLI